MSKVKNSISIARLKYNAVKLRANYQMPLQLYLLICSLTKESTESQIRYLYLASEHYLRVRGYWKKYHDQEKVVNVRIKEDFSKL